MTIPMAVFIAQTSIPATRHLEDSRGDSQGPDQEKCLPLRNLEHEHDSTLAPDRVAGTGNENIESVRNRSDPGT
jgi:hypothetical protein